MKNVPSLMLLLLVVLSFVIYSPALKGDFILDANYVVANNSVIEQPELRGRIWKEGMFDAYKSSFSSQLNYYRPMVMSSLALNYDLLGAKPLGFRLINILIHALNAFLVFILVSFLTRNQFLSIICGFLFCIHPVGEWVVSYVVGRADLLQCFFSLLSLIFVVNFLRTNNMVLLIISLFSFLAALLSREVAVLMPLFVGITSYVLTRDVKKSSLLFGVFFLMSFGYVLFRQNFIPIVSDQSLSQLSLSGFMHWLALTIQYNFRLLIPWSLGSVMSHFLENTVILALLSGALFFGATLFFSRKSKVPLQRVFVYSLLWLLAGSVSFYVTRDTFIKQGPYLAEHFLYFSLVGFAMLLGSFIVSLSANKQKVALVFVCAYFTAITMNSNAHWSSEEALLRRVVAKESGKNAVAYQQVLMKYSDDVESIQKMVESVKQPTNQSLWYKRLGSVYRQRKEYDQAYAYFQKSLTSNPGNVEAINELAVNFLEQGKMSEGKQWLKKSLTLDEQNTDALRLLGQVAYEDGRFHEAVPYYKSASFSSPDNILLLKHLAMSFFLDGNELGFQQIIDEIFSKAHDTESVLVFFIKEMYRHKRFVNVIYLIETNHELFDSNIEMLTMLGWSYKAMGQEEKSKVAWKKIFDLSGVVVTEK